MSEATERQSPGHQAYAHSSFDRSRGVELDVTGRFSRRLAGFQQPVDAYVPADGRIGRRLHPRVAIDLVGRDLLDGRHLEVGGSVLAGPLDEIRRSIHGSVAVSWKK